MKITNGSSADENQTHAGVESLDDKKLYELCQEYGKNARLWSRKFASLLPEVEKRKLYKKHNFYCIYDFAAKVGGLSRKTVDEILRTYRKLEDKPLLRAEIETQGYGKVRALLPLIKDAAEEDLVELVRNSSKQTIEKTAQEVKKQKEEQIINGDKSQIPPGWDLTIPTEDVQESPYVPMSFKVHKDIEFKLRKYQQKLEKERKEKVTFNEVLEALFEKVEQNEKSKKSKKRKNSQKITRYTPVAQRPPACKCTFPGCNKPSEEIHHPTRFALSKNHENLVPLCRTHHRIVHNSLIKNENDAPHLWQITTKPNKTDPKYAIDQKFIQHNMAATNAQKTGGP